ncbi:S8 family serine peptidase [Archangium lansingense]|uniref:S8 family serine peptidase n=1 Tax=Archangium lansingense TaxID=2995310 RepID=A0ABT4A5R8_9BACT|nr:S8 family serine peptidase [Archangium lansinium]MCY1076716.1 S8 family serine peptidase [Archangium lansinium]
MSLKSIGNSRPSQVRTEPSQTQTTRSRASEPAAPTNRVLESRFDKPAAAQGKRLTPGTDGTSPVRSFTQRAVEARAATSPLGEAGKAVKDFLSRLNPGDDTIAIFDSFGSGVTHGDDVGHVVDENSEYSADEIRTVGVGSTSAPPGASLDERIEHRTASFLDSTSDAMQGLLDNPGDITVINQSQSISPVRIADEMWRDVRNDPEAKAALAKELGLEEGASDTEVLQALVDRVDGVFENSKDIAKAKARYDDMSGKLEDAGILHVVTAGNTGDFLDTLDDMGVKYDGDFADSVLFNEHTLVVAASTGGLKDRIADFSTPSDFVTVAIDGTDIEVEGGRTADGTSFAAPQVTALIAEMRRINPDLTNDQVRDILAQAATDTRATEQEEGHGILDADKALALARASLLKDLPVMRAV